MIAGSHAELTLPFDPSEPCLIPQPKRRPPKKQRRPSTALPPHGGVKRTPVELEQRPLSEVIAQLQASGNLVHAHHVMPRPVQEGELAEPLPPPLGSLIPNEGLWSHQVEAINLLRKRESVVIATGTASGKSLAFQVPIVESIVSGIRPATSLLLYPTKALAQDQLRSFTALDVPDLEAVTYDGDTSRELRAWSRNNANVVLTNPEMLHNGILPQHVKWSAFLRRLEFVVIDELHVLRGIFGTHVSHVLRRLRRICDLYGADPTFVFCSATIGDPDSLATELCGKPVTAITNDGSPCAQRTIALVQPARIETDSVPSADGAGSLGAGSGESRRQSPATEAIRISSELVTSGRRTIVFCPSRSMTERVAAGISRSLPADIRDTVRPYRSGYLASERREIEDELAAGHIRCVVATSALELGVDIGGLDATVLCGFPGTIASLWQQVGRAGRSQSESLAILIAGDDQLDQWFVQHPEDLFTRPAEPAVVNVANPNVLDPHLGCAAYETPLQPRDHLWWADLDDGIRRLVVSDDLRVRPDSTQLPKAVWSGRGMPFTRIGLRSASGGEVKIVQKGDSENVVIGTVERARAANLVHPGAIYLHRGVPWLVESLNLQTRQASVVPADGKSWTQAKSSIQIDVLETKVAKPLGNCKANIGTVEVTTQTTGYQRKEAGSQRLLERVDFDTEESELPPQVLRTTAVWFEWKQDLLSLAGIMPHRVPGALHAAEHGAIGILPLFAICDRWDVGGVSIAEAPQTGLPTVFIYDGYAGGAGVADMAFTQAERLLTATVDLLDGCECQSGCPSCVQSPKCGNGNEPLEKLAAIALLRSTLGCTEPF